MHVLDLGFSLARSTLPLDHGYSLYAGLSRAVPELHGARWLGVHPISGTPSDDKTLILRDGARLLLRLPADRIPIVLPLAGKALDVAGAKISVGAPTVNALVPAASLDARIVVVKLTDAPHRENPELGREVLDVKAFAERYAVELRRQLDALNIGVEPQLRGRRSMTVAGKRIVGYSVRVSGLSADQSIALQVNGLGGKRRMGCGIFRATRGR